LFCWRIGAAVARIEEIRNRWSELASASTRLRTRHTLRVLALLLLVGSGALLPAATVVIVTLPAERIGERAALRSVPI